MTTELDVHDWKLFESIGVSPERRSLEALSGEIVDDDRTPMIQRAVKAWKTPLHELTCDQARLLLSQRMGIKWLAKPLIAFILKFPKASATFYAGDITLTALRIFSELLTVEPEGARAIAGLDLSWLTDNDDLDPDFMAENAEIIDAARSLARLN